MKQKKHDFLCMHSNPAAFGFAFLTKIYLPLAIIIILYFQYQFSKEFKDNFHGKIHLEDSNLYFPSSLENISFLNFSISIIFVFPDFLNQNEIPLLKICLRSWKNAFPDAEIFTCFSQKGIQHFNTFVNSLSNDEKEFKKINQFPQIEEDELGTIYVDDLFHKIFNSIHTDLVCVVNSYAILPIEIRNKIFFLSSFFSRKKQQFSAIGQRCAFQLQPNNININFSNIDAYHKAFLKDDLLKNVNIIENSMYSNDFIFFSLKNNVLNIDDIPSFHYGFDRYDTWIPGWMDEYIPVVSLGDGCGSYNIEPNHDLNFQDKLAENFEVARFHGDKFKISSRLKLRIKGKKLINDTEVIAVF